MAETPREKLSYVARLVALADVGSKREIRKQLLQMVGEVLDASEKEATILRGLELAARLTGACDMAALVEPMGTPDLKRFEKRSAAPTLMEQLEGASSVEERIRILNAASPVPVFVGGRPNPAFFSAPAANH